MKSCSVPDTLFENLTHFMKILSFDTFLGRFLHAGRLAVGLLVACVVLFLVSLHELITSKSILYTTPVH